LGFEEITSAGTLVLERRYIVWRAASGQLRPFGCEAEFSREETVAGPDRTTIVAADELGCPGFVGRWLAAAM
jgi:hypothetical protein